MAYSNNQNQSPEKADPHNQAKVNPTEASQPNDKVAKLLSNDKVSYQEVEGLTDTDQLQQTLDQSAASQNPEGSHGNENIRKAVENLDRDEMKHNLKDESAEKDGPSPNPAPFITPE